MNLGFDGKFLSAEAQHSAQSGNGVHARELLRHMAALDRAHRFLVYLVSRPAERLADPNVIYHRLSPLARNPYFRNLVEYPLRLAGERLDALMSFTTAPAAVRCPVVLLLADIFWIVHPELLPRVMAAPRTIAVRGSVRRAEVIVTPTEFSRRDIVAHLGVPPDKVVVVPHGVRTQFAQPIDAGTIAEVRARHGIRDPFVLSVNDIHPRKNLERLVDAFARLKHRDAIPHQLVLVGRTLWEYPELFRRVEHSGCRDQILVPGYLPSGDVRALYQAADLFVYPSLYEGWGLQVHEAMSSGVPTAVSAGSAQSEIAGDAAVTFDPLDVDDMARTMLSVLQDAGLRRKLVELGRQQIAKFSWSAAARRMLDLCRAVGGAGRIPA